MCNLSCALALGAVVILGNPIGDAHAQAASAARAVSADRTALASDLVRITNGEALTRLQTEKMLAESLPKTLAADPEFASLERQHPGIGKAFLAAMKPIILDYTARSLPDLWRRLAPVYSEAFDASELSTLLAFYRSTTGQKLIGVIGQEADFSAALSQAISDPDSKITPGNIERGQNAGIAALQRRMTAAEFAEIAKLEAWPLGPRLLVTNARMREIVAEWGNASDPALEAEIEKALQPVMQRFLEAKGAPK